MRIGLLNGWEDGFPRALVERLGEHAAGEVACETLSLAGCVAGRPLQFDLILDRLSHRLPFYRHVLLASARAGVRVLNDPRSLAIGDRFAALDRCRAVGIAVPRAVLLPKKEQPRDTVPGVLDHLAWPQPWEAYLEAVGGSGILLPVHCASPRPGLPVSSTEELIAAFDRTGSEAVFLREARQWDRYARCITVGRDRVIVCRFDPVAGRCLADPAFLEPDLEQEAVNVASAVCRELGLDLAAVDFAISGGELRLVEAWNPYPDLEPGSLTPFYFEKVVEEVAGWCARPVARGHVRGSGDAAPRGNLQADAPHPLRIPTGRRGPARRRRPGSGNRRRTRRSLRRAVKVKPWQGRLPTVGELEAAAQDPS